MENKEKTNYFRLKKYNCAQAVAFSLLPFINEKVDEITLFKMTEALGGGGCGTQKGTCGALSGAQLIIGLAESNGNLENPDSSDKTYKFGQKVNEEFNRIMKSYICEDIKKDDNCEKAIETAINLTKKALQNKD
ncbi:MAG: C-GCAxxG-C-C family protein [Sphaerochaetaceae bacterium]